MICNKKLRTIENNRFIALFKYNSVKATLDAQFGINPIKPPIKGPNILSFINNYALFYLKKCLLVKHSKNRYNYSLFFL